jgi:RHS repeat-associated protein
VNLQHELFTGQSPPQHNHARYDAENRLSTTAGVTYTYDGDGNRVKKSNGKLYWTGGGSDPLEETDLAGTATADYIFGNGKRTARVDLPGGTVHYYLSDHLGSASEVVGVVNNAAVIQDESDYYPYGGERTITDNDANNYKFTGKERDSESGLDNFGARYFTSSMGRFMTPDWSARPTTVPYATFGDPQSLNLYGYVRNDPVSRADADGHDVVLDNTTDRDRRAAAARITKNLTPQERAMFKVGVNAQTHKTELQLKQGANVGGQHTSAFNRLVTEVNDHQHTATVKLQSTYTDPQTGQVKSVAHDAGGGVTFSGGNLGQGNTRILLAPEGNLSDAQHPGTLPGANGGLVEDKSHTVAAHELMGHGFEVMTTGHTQQDTTVQWENQMRQEQGLGERAPE